VGQKASNELGLYDMSGNVWEWCWDASSSYRRIRGGSWDYSADSCTVSYRNNSLPGRPEQRLRLPPCPQFWAVSSGAQVQARSSNAKHFRDEHPPRSEAGGARDEPAVRAEGGGLLRRVALASEQAASGEGIQKGNLPLL
jgi:hypothetical protein